MLSNATTGYNKRHILNFEDKPPEKKLISDGDILIKRLAEKQQCTKTTLQEQLLYNKEFRRGGDFVSLTQYTAGPSSLERFCSITRQSDEVEQLKSLGLTSADVELYLSSKLGEESPVNKQKYVNKPLVEKRLKEISQVINNIKAGNESSRPPANNHGRLAKESMLSTKPNSVETKLLKFALDNEKKRKKLPHPMDNIHEIEAKLLEDLSPVDIKKIRKKARSLGNQINAISETVRQEPKVKPKKNCSLVLHSKWDVKETETPAIRKDVTKSYTCKPQNYYTIRSGEIVPINSPKQVGTVKLSVEEIKELSKFSNYDPGTPSKILYLKNLSNHVTEDELKQLFRDFQFDSIKIMNGRMRGQAFVEFKDAASAKAALHHCNGLIIRNKPVIIQFGKAK